ncbi:MAG: translocation/assembly module TamB domain-containing protein, partial [Deltaproteobacteria bacterium]
MFRHFRRLLYGLLALAILVLAGLATVTTPWFHRYLEQRVTAELHRLTGAQVDIGQMQFSLFALQITLNDLVLHGTEESSVPPLFRAHTLALRLRPLSIPRGTMTLGALDLNAAEIHIQTRADGSTNIPGPVMSTAGGPDYALDDFLDLAIRRMTINHTDVYWNNQHFRLNVKAQNVAVQMRRDRPRSYQGSLSSSSVEFKSSDMSIPSTTVTARFEITPAGIDVPTLNWRAEGFSGESTIHVKAGSSLRAEAVFNSRGRATHVAKIFGLTDISAGEVYVNGRASYAEDGWQASGRLEGRQLLPAWRAFQPGPIGLITDYRASPERLLLSNLRIAALGGSARGQGEVLFPPGPAIFSLRTNVQGVRLRALLASISRNHPVLNRLPWSSSVGGTVSASWKGSWQNLDSQFALDFRSGGNPVGGDFPLDGLLRAKLTRERNLALEIQSLDAHTPHSSLQVQGTIANGHSQLAAELKTSDFEEWRTPVEFLSQATQPVPLKLLDEMSISATLADTPDGLEIRERVSGGRFVYRGWSWDELSAHTVFNPRSAQISGATLRREKSSLHFEASAALRDWELAPDQPVTATVRADRTPLGGLKTALGITYPLDGIATGQLKFEGTPGALGAGGDITVEQGRLAGHEFDRLTANLHLADSAWSVHNLRLVKGKSQISGEGSYDLSTRAFKASLHGADIDLADLYSAPKPNSRSATVKPVEGRAEIDLDGSGTPEDVTLRAQWNIQDLRIAGTPAGGLRGRLTWQGQELDAAGESFGNGETLHFAGKARTEGDWPAEFSGEFTDFQFTPWIRLLMNGKFESSAKGSGTVKATGPLLKLKKWVIEGQLAKVEVASTDLSWTNSQPVDIRFAAGQLDIGRFRLQGPSTDLEVEGSVRIGEEASLALSAKGESDAKLLSLLDPAVKATGNSKVNLVVNGTPVHPLLFGSLNVQDLNLTYGDFPIRLFGMNGEIRLEGERATVQSLRGTSGGGTITVQGYMTMGALPRFELTAQVDQVRMQYPTDFIPSLSGNLRLAGTPLSSRMEGELIVRQLYAAPDFSVLGLLSDVGASAATPPIGAASPVASRVQLGVQVLSAPTVRLEAPDLTMVADVDLRLQGTLADPVVVGGIHILNGEAVVRGNRYRLNRADISMTNPFRTQLMLDLEATTRVQQYNLTMDVSGTLDRFKIAYRSDPPLPTSDILSLLALGYSRQQKQATTTGSDRTSTVAASSLLSEALSSQTSGRIQRLFGVSRIRIDPNVGGPENIAGSRVTVEQQVTRELTLTYITDTGSSQRR